MVKIFLDAGHGGKDSGAIGNDLYEKNIVLDLAKRIEQKLQAYKNVDIKLIKERKMNIYHYFNVQIWLMHGAQIVF